jgi:hypothetical protein
MDADKNAAAPHFHVIAALVIAEEMVRLTHGGFIVVRVSKVHGVGGVRRLETDEKINEFAHRGCANTRKDRPSAAFPT